MSTLLIEGGQRLSGRIDVEGNKNSALPLLAACLITGERCVLENVPRIGDVEVMARLLLDLGAEVDGIGTNTLTVRAPEIVKDQPDPSLVGRLRGSVLLLGPLLARRGRVHIAPPGGDFPAKRTIDTHLTALKAMGAREIRGARPRARGAGWPARRFHLPGRGLGDGHGDGASGRGLRDRTDRDPPRRDRAARRRVVSVPVEDGGRHRGRGHVDDSRSKASPRGAARRTRSGATTSTPAAGPSSARLPAARSRCAARARQMSKWRPLSCVAWASTARSTTRSSSWSRARLVVCGPHHHGALAELPERSREPRHGARDAGRRTDARARLDVRAATLRPRPDERHARGLLPLRSASDHRQRAEQTARALARQPRSAIRDVVDCRRPGCGRGESRSARSKPSSAATARLIERLQSLGAQRHETVLSSRRGRNAG